MDTFTKIFLIRHTQTINTLDGKFRYNGFIDVDVCPHGLKLIEKYIPFFKKRNINKIYSSDLIRAKKGADIFKKTLNIPLILKKELREVKQGIWEGLTYEEIIEKYPEEAKKKFNDYVNYRVKDAENLVDASIRVNNFIKEVIEENKGKEIIVVAHGGINTLIILNALKMELKDFFRIKQDFGCLNEIDFFDDFTKVIRLNYIPIEEI